MKALKVTGLIIMAAGLLIGFANLQGCFQKSLRTNFLRWVLESDVGMPIDQSAAIEFMKRFPPPQDAIIEELTHITKQGIRSKGGPPMLASIYYMHRDGSRTTYVATLNDVRDWASESSYDWIAWFLMLFGFFEILLTYILEWKKSKVKSITETI